MSNELIIATDKLPDYIREMGGYVDEGLAAGVQARSPKFGITIDKAFTITEEGQTIILQGPDGYPVRTVVGVIIAASDTLTKAWYEKTYEAGNFDAPDCFSNDGKVPAPGVAKPQHSNCAACPKNAFGSHPVTGRGKACNDRKMIVMVWQGAPDKLLTFNVPTMSLGALAKLNNELKNANIALQSVAVQFSFDMSKTYSVVKIGTVGFVDKDSFLKYKSLSESDEVRSLLREVDYDPPEPAPKPEEVVPQNTINFGGAGQGQQNEAQQSQQTQAQGSATGQGANLAGDPAPGTQAPPKRARRTKAQMEADAAAEAARKAAAQQPVEQGGINLAQMSNTGSTQQAQPTMQEAQRQQPVDPDPSVVATQQTQNVAQQTSGANTGGGVDVMGLLSKWQNK